MEGEAGLGRDRGGHAAPLAEPEVLADLDERLGHAAGGLRRWARVRQDAGGGDERDEAVEEPALVGGGGIGKAGGDGAEGPRSSS